MKFEVLGGQRIDQKRNKGWWRGSRERIEMEAQKVTELTIEGTSTLASACFLKVRFF